MLTSLRKTSFNRTSLLFGLLCGLVAPACVTPSGQPKQEARDNTDGDDGEELRDEALKLDVPWEDLTSQLGGRVPGEQIAMAKPQNTQLAAGGVKSAAVKLLRVPAPAAVKFQLAGAYPYEGGSLGWIGSAKAYVASTATIPDDNRLYWVMVKVLSEKFSCFMTDKHNSGAQLLVRCRDGRRVLLKRERGRDFVQFHARQYDQEGYEILVKNHRKMRVDGAAGLYSVLAVRNHAAAQSFE